MRRVVRRHSVANHRRSDGFDRFNCTSAVSEPQYGIAGLVVQLVMQLEFGRHWMWRCDGRRNADTAVMRCTDADKSIRSSAGRRRHSGNVLFNAGSDIRRHGHIRSGNSGADRDADADADTDTDCYAFAFAFAFTDRNRNSNAFADRD